MTKKRIANYIYDGGLPTRALRECLEIKSSLRAVIRKKDHLIYRGMLMALRNLTDY